MRRRRAIHPSQEPLFVGEDSSVASERTGFYSWQLADEDPQLKAYLDAKAAGVPMVDVLSRAERIYSALNQMSARSSIDNGFLTAVDTPSGERIRDEEYPNGVFRIVANFAEAKLARRDKKIKETLWPAMGYAAMRDLKPRILRRPEINARARHDWKNFRDTFTGTPNNQRRQEYKKIMRRHIKTQKALRKRFEAELEQAAA